MSGKELKAMAVKVAYNAVDSAHPFKQEEYMGDGFYEGIYCVDGLAEDILEHFDYYYPNQKPTESILSDIAFDLV
jgi:hypothetical protein